jgi:hypothetical protein
VENALLELKAGDEHLYDYIENLQVSHGDGNSEDVIVSVSSKGQVKGKQVGENADTKYSISGARGNYNGDKILLPFRRGTEEIGFDVSLFGAPSYMDVHLADEIGDIMFVMEYNTKAVSEGGNSRYFKGGGGGLDAYLNSPSGSYSNKVENLYKERKKLEKKENIWPLVK